MPYDTRRSNQIFRCKKCSAHNGRPAAGLHLQICLHEGRNTGLCVAMDLMRSALRSASDVPLDHSWWQILWRWNCCCCFWFCRWRCDRRLCPGLAPAGGGMVCTSDSLSSNRDVIKMRGSEPNSLPLIF